MSISSFTSKPLTGSFVLIVTVTFFAVIIGVNMVVMRLAISTLPGTDVDSAYRSSLYYQHEIDAAHAQDMRHWNVKAKIMRTSDGAVAVELDVRDSGGQPLSDIKFSGQLERPVDKRVDRVITFVEADRGVYRGTAFGIAPGQWDLVLEGDITGERIFLSKNRVILN